MRLLLDTHALIWWQNGSDRLPPQVRDTLAAPEHTVFFSAVNAFEIALKWRLGKLTMAAELIDRFEVTLAEQGLEELPVRAAHALAAGMLHFSHRDPFDRLLIGQATTENLVLISNEKIFDRTGVKRLWD